MTTAIAQAAITLTQWIELSVPAKATVLLALGLVAARLASRAPAAVRHLLLAATLAASMALPLAALAIPNVLIEVPVAQPAARTTVVDRATDATPSTIASATAPLAHRSDAPRSVAARFTIASVLRVIWVAGVAALCLSLAAGVWRLRRIRRDGLPRPELQELVDSLALRAGVGRVVGVLEHEHLAAPLTCGVWRPVILLPVDARTWTDAALRRALVHELEHVRRGDWAVQLASRVACACYWFHPLAWVALRQLCLEAERACDDAVVRSEERTDYADQLVLLARRLSTAHGPAMLGMANRSDLATRVGALLDDHQRRGRAGTLAATGAIAAAAVVVTAIAPVRAIATAAPAVAARPTIATTATPSLATPSPAASAPSASAATGSPNQAQPQPTSRRENTRDTRPRVRSLDRALTEAAAHGDLDEINELIAAGANVNARVDGDGSPLIEAARRNRVDIVRRLLDAGADPDLAVEGDGNPLIAAAQRGSAAAALLLLDRGAHVDMAVPGDENALIQASGSGHLEVVKLLVARGANVNARIWADSWRGGRTGEWRTPLGMAYRGGHKDVFAYLLSVGAR